MPFTGWKNDTLEQPGGGGSCGPGGGRVLSQVPPHSSSSHSFNLEKWSRILRCGHLAFDGYTVDLWKGTLKGQKASASVALVSDTGACFSGITVSFPSRMLQN